MRVVIIFGMVCLSCILSARAQSCPAENPNGPGTDSAPQTLVGKVVYHDEIRQWFGLKLDRSVCGLQEIQVLQGGGAFEVDGSDAHLLEVFRGCRVTTHGTLGIPSTGYYSADIYQIVDKIEAEPGCARQPPFPDFSRLKPDSKVRSYRVSISMAYQARGGHISVVVQSGKRLLTPWPVYASYSLTGGYAFYAYCGEGFLLSHMQGTPEAKPWTMDNEVIMDPETAAEENIHLITLDYTCRG